MRETRSSSDSFSIETEAASIEISADPSMTGIAWITVMSSSISSAGNDSQTIARAAGRSGLAGAPEAGLVPPAAADLSAAAAADLLAAAGADLPAAAGADLPAAGFDLDTGV